MDGLQRIFLSPFFLIILNNKKNFATILHIQLLTHLFATSFHFSCRVYKEEVRDRLDDPLATRKIQGAKSCQVKFPGNINS